MAATNLTARSSHASRANLFPPALLAQLVEHLHGKEGVNGSSPLEGSARAPHVGAFAFTSTCEFSRVRSVWSRYGAFKHAGRPLLRQIGVFHRLVGAAQRLVGSASHPR